MNASFDSAGMTSAVRTYMRPDEKQFVFILGGAVGFTIAEVAESWHGPQRDEPNVCFQHYPVIFYTDRFSSLDSAAAEVARRYPWSARSTR